MDANVLFRENAIHQSGNDEPTSEFLLLPVRFLPRRVAPAIRALAHFAAVAGGIVNGTALGLSDKLAWLDGLAALINGEEPALSMDPAVVQTVRDFVAVTQAAGGNLHHANHILQARRQDVRKCRYRDWNDLLAYCRYAASPYGRFVLEVTGGDKILHAPTEALCCAVQLLLMLRDCRRAYRVHDRVYLPERWFKEAGTDVTVLAVDSCDGPLCQVFAKALESVDRLLLTARPLPGLARDRRLRAAAAASVFLAERVARQWRINDPFVAKLTLTWRDRLGANCHGYRAAVWP